MAHSDPVTPPKPAAKRRSRPRPSLRMAVNDFCKACLYDPLVDGSWRAQVKACTAPKCPIFRVRPGR